MTNPPFPFLWHPLSNQHITVMPPHLLLFDFSRQEICDQEKESFCPNQLAPHPLSPSKCSETSPLFGVLWHVSDSLSSPSMCCKTSPLFRIIRHVPHLLPVALRQVPPARLGTWGRGSRLVRGTKDHIIRRGKRKAGDRPGSVAQEVRIWACYCTLHDLGKCSAYMYLLSS